ncbi:hypothetical protein BHE74_00055603 [Ensete ventricosum]|nr:hypothetical protein BHE74_00055603 [Ensete ventricosum]
MTTNTPSSVYKPLHEYRILRVSNSPHLCEFYTTLSVVTQHVPLCTVSSLTKYPTCLEHYQVWLSTSSPEKATNHDGKHHGEPEEQPTQPRVARGALELLFDDFVGSDSASHGLEKGRRDVVSAAPIRLEHHLKRR